MIGAIIGAVGSVVGAIGQGIFGFKTAQAQTMQKALDVISSVDSSDNARAAAIASVVVAESSAGGLARMWRPLIMLVFCGIILCAWFGIVPSHIDQPLSPMLAEIFLIIKIGIGGYIPMRSFEKIISSAQVGKVLQSFIEKKLL